MSNLGKYKQSSWQSTKLDKLDMGQAMRVQRGLRRQQPTTRQHTAEDSSSLAS